MNPLILFIPLITLIFLGIPLGFVLGAIGLTAGFVEYGSKFFSILPSRMFDMQTNYILVALPMFVWMGNMLERSGATEKLYGALHLAMGGLKGGLAYATIIICVLFAAATGVVGASVTAMGLVALPEMVKRGYDKKFASGVVMAAGCLGILIPPSIMLVIYGSWAELSVGRLYMAALLPGVMLGGLYALYTFIVSRVRPKWVPAATIEERGQQSSARIWGNVAKYAVPPIFLILLVLGGIFMGWFTPTEASGIGAIGAAIIAAFNKNFNMANVKEATYRTARISGMIGLLSSCALTFTSAFLALGGGRAVNDVLLGTGFGKWGIFAIIMVLLLILGAFLDWFGMLVICIPIFNPLVLSLGFDPMWFAALVCINLQMSFLTPPYGFALFYLRGICPMVCPEVKMSHIIGGIYPWLGLVCVAIGLLIAFPQIALWLPAAIYNK